MSPPKKPPPDTVGNVRGRIKMLETRARQAARADAKDGTDYVRALGRHMKAIEGDLGRLRERLARARDAAGDPGPGADSADDLLDTLGSLGRRPS